MPNAALNKTRRFYATAETVWGTAVPPTNSDAFRAVSLDFVPTQPFEVRPDVNPTLSPVLGTAMRKSCTWSGQASLAGSGTAGTAPDIAKILKAGFGKVTVNPATSVVYSVQDNYPPLAIDLWQYVSPSTATQLAALAAIVQKLKFSFGQNFALVDFSGEAIWGPDSGQITGGLADAGAGGLVAWPTEPTTPVLNGNAIQGFKGTITLDGNTYSILRSGDIEIASARAMPKDTWGSDYPTSPIDDVRTITVNLNFYDDDSANLASLKQKIYAGTPFDATFAVGVTAGNICTTTTKNLQCTTKPKYDGSTTKRAFSVTVLGHTTSSAATDEISQVWT